MISKKVLLEIDKVIKETWVNNMCSDYEEHYMLKEDSMKCCLYYHLRRKLAKILRENNLRIFTEYYFKDLKYRADMAIVELDSGSEKSYLGDRVKNVIAIFELKFDGGNSARTIDTIKSDVFKIKDYIQTGKLLCQYYFAVIYEAECVSLNWFDKRNSNNWAKGYVTELDAGRYVNGDGETWFTVYGYNDMNPGYSN